MRVLIVDDNPINREFLRLALGGRVARLDVAADGAHALEVALRTPPHLVVLDIHMPEMDGLECLRRLRAQQSGGLPAIALTADTRREERERLFAGGFDAFVGKPADPAVLIAAIHRACGLPGGGEQSERSDTTQAGPASARLLDDEAAGRANLDNNKAVKSMRALLADELAATRRELACLAATDRADLRALLHRWRGACGYAGAERLARACRELERSPDHAAAGTEYLRLARTLALTRAALTDTGDESAREYVSSPPPPPPGR